LSKEDSVTADLNKLANKLKTVEEKVSIFLCVFNQFSVRIPKTSKRRIKWSRR
jgi:hypothetical protein